jgi:polyisoprenoid-binding protein YceI
VGVLGLADRLTIGHEPRWRDSASISLPARPTPCELDLAREGISQARPKEDNSMFRSRHLLAVSAFVALLAPSPAGAKLTKVDGANVAHFSASGPGGLKIEGSTPDVLVADDGANITVTVPLANLDTGIKLRNGHMRDKYLEVGKYPNAVLVVGRAAITVPAPGAAHTADVAGTMTIHGTTRPVTVHYSASRSGNAIQVTGNLDLNINDYKIVVPSYLGVTVKPDIKVDVKFSVNDV